MTAPTTLPARIQPRPGATVTTTAEKPGDGYVFRSYRVEATCECGETRMALIGGNLSAERAWEVNADAWSNPEEPTHPDDEPDLTWDIPRNRAKPIRCGTCLTEGTVTSQDDSDDTDLCPGCGYSKFADEDLCVQCRTDTDKATTTRDLAEELPGEPAA